jgi:hypothetical protein
MFPIWPHGTKIESASKKAAAAIMQPTSFERSTILHLGCLGDLSTVVSVSNNALPDKLYTKSQINGNPLSVCIFKP